MREVVFWAAVICQCFAALGWLIMALTVKTGNLPRDPSSQSGVTAPTSVVQGQGPHDAETPPMTSKSYGEKDGSNC